CCDKKPIQIGQIQAFMSALLLPTIGCVLSSLQRKPSSISSCESPMFRNLQGCIGPSLLTTSLILAPCLVNEAASRHLTPVSEEHTESHNESAPASCKWIGTDLPDHWALAIWVDRYCDWSEKSNEEPAIQPQVRLDIFIHGLPFMNDQFS